MVETTSLSGDGMKRKKILNSNRDTMLVPETPNIDTREADTNPTLKKLEFFNAVHVNSVIALFNMFIYEYSHEVYAHDIDKFDESAELQLKNFIESRSHRVDFRSTLWYKGHAKHSRHHIADHAKVNTEYINDVNLIDVLHMLSDWVVAAIARTAEGEVIKPGRDFNQQEMKALLWHAFMNTIQQMLLLSSKVQYFGGDE